MSTSRSKRPKRRRAASMLLGLLVAAMTITWALCFSPSMRVSSWDTMRRSTSPCVFSLLGAMASSSSMKMMEGEFFSASSKALRRLLSDSPASLLMISGPLIRKKKAPVSLATARAIRVLPVPGGPYRRMPLGGLTPMALKRLGCRRGSSTISLIWASCLRQPPMSS
uniref:Putative conserved secreted protein n=1 Tax=Ixodes ricinus TaxID=34613 RepID=A0A6B0UY97_IXORI